MKSSSIATRAARDDEGTPDTARSDDALKRSESDLTSNDNRAKYEKGQRVKIIKKVHGKRSTQWGKVGVVTVPLWNEPGSQDWLQKWTKDRMKIQVGGQTKSFQVDEVEPFEGFLNGDGVKIIKQTSSRYGQIGVVLDPSCAVMQYSVKVELNSDGAIKS